MIDAQQATGLVLLLFLLYLVAVVSAFCFWIWMIVDCVSQEEPSAEKVVWLCVLILLPCLGAIIYMFARRIPRRRGTAKNILPPRVNSKP